MVAEDNSLFLTAMAIDLIDDVADLLLRQKSIDQIKADRRVAGEDLRQQHATRRRLYTLHNRLAVGIDSVEAGLDPCMQRDGLRRQGLLDLTDAREQHAFAGFARTLHCDVIKAQDD